MTPLPLITGASGGIERTTLAEALADNGLGGP